MYILKYSKYQKSELSDSMPDNGLGKCVIRRVDKFLARKTAVLINTGIAARACLVVTGTRRIWTLSRPVKGPFLALGCCRTKSVSLEILAEFLVDEVAAAIVLGLCLEEDARRLRLPADYCRPAGAN